MSADLRRRISVEDEACCRCEKAGAEGGRFRRHGR